MQTVGMRFVALSLSLLLLTSCTPEPSRETTICGSKSVSLEPIPLAVTVASTANGVGSIVAALGAKSALLGSDLASDVGVEIINPGHEISLERLLALSPDLVFVDENEPDDLALKAIEAIGAKTVALRSPSSLEESLRQIGEVAQALGIPRSGERLVQKIQSELEEITSNGLDGARVAFLYLRGNAGLFLIAGKGSGADELIRTLGGRDVGSDLGVKGFAPITPESLRIANPDFIIVMEKGLESIGGRTALLRLPGVAGTLAAENDAFLVGKDSELLSFGPGTPKVLACLLEQAR